METSKNPNILSEDEAARLLQEKLGLSEQDAWSLVCFWKQAGRESRNSMHRQIGNYIANDLGFDRNAILAMLSQKIEDRNPTVLVKEHVERYFRARPDGSYTMDGHVRSIIEDETRKYVKQQLASGLGTCVNAEVQRHLDDICGKEPRKADMPDMGLCRPNATRYHGAVLLGWTLVKAIATEWAANTCVESPELNIQVNQDAHHLEGWNMAIPDVRKFSERDRKVFKTMLNDNELARWPLALTDHEYVLPLRICHKILTSGIGGLAVKRTVKCPDGLLCLPDPL